MLRRLITRLDNWALDFEGTVLETSQVWYDGTPVYVYIPHRPAFLIRWLKGLWAPGATRRFLKQWLLEVEQSRGN